MKTILYNDFFNQEFTPDEVRNRGLNMFKNSNLITDKYDCSPGIRKNVPPDIQEYIKEKVSDSVSILLEHEKIPVVKNAQFDILYNLTTSIHKQGIVHEDEDHSIAGVIYLNPNPPKNSGTKFYRKKKEYEGDNWTDSLHWQQKKQLATMVYRMRAVFVTEDEELLANFGRETEYYNKTYYEEEKNIENVYNSLILYPGKYHHSAGQYFGETLEDSRLSIVIFANVNYPSIQKYI